MFILKIYFAGLIAFAAGANGQVHVLLVDARSEQKLSEHATMPPHVPVLLTQGLCAGDCGNGNQAVANYLGGGVGKRTAPEAIKSNLKMLSDLIGSGGVWRLDDSILTLHTGNKPSRVDTQGLDRVADIDKLVPGAGLLDEDVLAENPRKGLITARLTLNSGILKTYSWVRVDQQIATTTFRRLDEAASKHGPGAAPKEAATAGQPLAGWVVAEIEVNGDSFLLQRRPLRGGAPQSMRIYPVGEEKEGEPLVVEMAILNQPDDNFGPPKDESESTLGTHFIHFYRLSSKSFATGELMVPDAVMDEKGKVLPFKAAVPESVPTEFVKTLLGRKTTRANLGRPVCAVVYFPAANSQ